MEIARNFLDELKEIWRNIETPTKFEKYLKKAIMLSLNGEIAKAKRIYDAIDRLSPEHIDEIFKPIKTIYDF